MKKKKIEWKKKLHLCFDLLFYLGSTKTAVINDGAYSVLLNLDMTYEQSLAQTQSELPPYS